MDYKKYLKFIIASIVTVLLLFLVFYIVKKSQNNQGNNFSGVNAPADINNKPRLITDEEKDKFNVKTNKEVFIETVSGNKNFPGPLPVLILPQEEITAPPQPINEKIDTDGDGLTDFEELKIFHTNPENPDSDNDGIKDAEAIKQGLIKLK